MANSFSASNSLILAEEKKRKKRKGKQRSWKKLSMKFLLSREIFPNDCWIFCYGTIMNFRADNSTNPNGYLASVRSSSWTRYRPRLTIGGNWKRHVAEWNSTTYSPGTSNRSDRALSTLLEYTLPHDAFVTRRLARLICHFFYRSRHPTSLVASNRRSSNRKTKDSFDETRFLFWCPLLKFLICRNFYSSV